MIEMEAEVERERKAAGWERKTEAKMDGMRKGGLESKKQLSRDDVHDRTWLSETSASRRTREICIEKEKELKEKRRK